MKCNRTYLWLLTGMMATCLFLNGLSSVNAHEMEAKNPGQFYLVSLGVGDPDLITVRAIETIKESDIIICRPETREVFSKYLAGKTFWDGAFREWRTYKTDCATLTDKAKIEKCQNDKKVRDAVEADIREALKHGKTVSVLGSGDLLINFFYFFQNIRNLFSKFRCLLDD